MTEAEKLQQYVQAVNGLNAQLQAHKEFIRDMTEQNLSIRTNLVMFQNAHKELAEAQKHHNGELQVLRDQVASLQDQVKNLESLNEELKKPVIFEEVAEVV